MADGAFAFLDCLGFKGVWNRGVQAADIIDFLEQAKASKDTMGMVLAMKASLPNIEHKVVFISDTVAVSMRLRQMVQQPDLAAGYLVDLTAHMAAELGVRFASGPLPLLFRGCITFGAHLATDSFILGPSVDEAASLAETSQGAFVWLHPNAANLRKSLIDYEQDHVEAILAGLGPDDRLARAEQGLNNLLEYSPTLRAEEMSAIVDWWRGLSIPNKHKVSTIALREIWRPSRKDIVIEDYPVQMKNGGI